MTRLTVNLNPASVARLDAIKAHVGESFFFLTPTNTDLVARGLELLCAELGIREPAVPVPTDRANEEGE